MAAATAPPAHPPPPRPPPAPRTESRSSSMAAPTLPPVHHHEEDTSTGNAIGTWFKGQYALYILLALLVVATLTRGSIFWGGTNLTNLLLPPAARSAPGSGASPPSTSCWHCWWSPPSPGVRSSGVAPT